MTIESNVLYDKYNKSKSKFHRGTLAVEVTGLLIKVQLYNRKLDHYVCTVTSNNTITYKHSYNTFHVISPQQKQHWCIYKVDYNIQYNIQQ